MLYPLSKMDYTFGFRRSYNGFGVCEVPNEVRDLGGRGATPGAVYPPVK